MKEIISPTILTSEGKLHYGQSSRSFCIIRLKSAILDFFRIGKSREKRYSYKLEIFGYNYELFKEKMNKAIDDRKVMPILLYLYEDDINEEFKRNKDNWW